MPASNAIHCLFLFSAAVVLVFFVCWTPFHAQRLMFVIVTLQGSWTTTNGFAHHVLFLASGKKNIPSGNFLLLMKNCLDMDNHRLLLMSS